MTISIENLRSCWFPKPLSPGDQIIERVDIGAKADGDPADSGPSKDAIPHCCSPFWRGSITSMTGRRRAAEPHLAQRECERDSRQGNQRQRPEHVDISEVARLRLNLLADPGKGLLLGLRERTAVRGEIVH